MAARYGWDQDVTHHLSQIMPPEQAADLVAALRRENTTSAHAELADRAAENRELRREAGRAAELIEAGDHAQAASLLRYISRPATT
ncbi:hypothetical protein [Streptomyces poriferorum]|uniref:Uncharacterized protein n=1 Tax=Streptomyces poriferorum TaxID=2798799 RepID=A0ABY9IY66_9ACTN|nr:MULTISPECIES: hypothetical protein [unclassified Streptomyces]MDP5310406.1 hypothetical protein [Streptomyces sp. Alt4]WLQ60440.1 hypothetical protein P8A19_35675 [Streptomyces sp. Alt2]